MLRKERGSVSAEEILVRPHLGLLCVGLVLSLVSVFLTLLQPHILMLLIGDLTNSQGLPLLITALVLLILVEGFVCFLQTRLLTRVGARVVSMVQSRIVDRVLAWPVSSFSRWGGGELGTVINSDASRMRWFTAGALFDLVSSAFLALGSLGFMFWINMKLAVLVLALVGAVAVLSTLLTAPIRRLAVSAQKEAAALADDLVSTVESIRCLKADGSVHERRAAMNAKILSIRNSVAGMGDKQSWMNPIVNSLANGVLVVVVLYGALLVHWGQLDLPGLAGFVMYLVVSLAPVQSGLKALPAIQESYGSWERIKGVIADDPSLDCSGSNALGEQGKIEALRHPTSSNRVDTYRGMTLADSFGGECRVSLKSQDPKMQAPEVLVRDLRHSFGDRCIYDNLTRTFEAGSVTALWGPSGSGKSCLLDVLAGLVPPTSGEVFVGGRLISSTVSGQVSYLEQKTRLIGKCVREYLRLGNLATDEEMLQALEELGLGEGLGARSEWLGAELHQRGLRLSGGEAQRLAFARILVSPKPLVLMDEPTSGADLHSATKMLAAVDRLRGWRTVVIATHDEAVLANCDNLLDLNQYRHDALSTSRTPVLARRAFREYEA